MGGLEPRDRGPTCAICWSMTWIRLLACSELTATPHFYAVLCHKRYDGGNCSRWTRSSSWTKRSLCGPREGFSVLGMVGSRLWTNLALCIIHAIWGMCFQLHFVSPSASRAGSVPGRLVDTIPVPWHGQHLAGVLYLGLDGSNGINNPTQERSLWMVRQRPRV